jgi:hypothetical protein
MHDESLEPRAYARLHADRYLWQEQQERAVFWRRSSAEWSRIATSMLSDLESAGWKLGVIGFAAGFMLAAFISEAARHAGWL